MPAPVAVVCAICERSLLVGERPVRFSPDGREYLDVCPLCKDAALDMGWFREGLTFPLVPAERRRPRGFLASLFQPKRELEPLPEPILRRLSEPEQAIVEAVALFNASAFRRTVEGVARSLGSPQVSVLALSGFRPEVVITVAWDISWYQYRVDFDSSQPVRNAERGLDANDIDESFRGWNARLDDDGYILPDLELG
jgi:hypothetical protein